MTPDTLHAHLRTVIEERLTIARAAAEGAGGDDWTLGDTAGCQCCVEVMAGTARLLTTDDRYAPLIALHDPADAVRRYEAGLKLLDAFDETRAFYEAPENRSVPAGEVHGLWTAVLLLAASLGVEVE